MRLFVTLAFLLVANAATTQPDLQAACFESDYIADPQETVVACSELIAAVPSNENVLLYAMHVRGIAKRQAGDIQGSISDFETILQATPDDTATLRMLAWTYREQGNSQRAENMYSNILELDDHWQGWLSRCAVRTDLGKYLAAVSDCDRVEERVNGDPDADPAMRASVMRDVWYFTAVSFININRPARAAAIARQGLGMDDISGRLYYVTLVGLWNSNQVEEVDAILAAGLRRYPEDADLLYFLSEWNKR